MSRFDLVILDYDGVVADSELLNNQAMAEVLSDLGLPTTVDDALALYMGRRWLDCIIDISTRLGRECPASTQDDWARLCHQRAATSLTPVTGVKSFLEGLQQPRCVASSSPPEWILLGLRTMGISPEQVGPIFSGAVHVARGKPNPDLFLYAADQMGAPPSRALVIEDSVPGVQAGVAAGMTVVGLVAGGHIRPGHAERLAAAGAHEILASFRQVEALING